MPDEPERAKLTRFICFQPGEEVGTTDALVEDENNNLWLYTNITLTSFRPELAEGDDVVVVEDLSLTFVVVEKGS